MKHNKVTDRAGQEILAFKEKIYYRIRRRVLFYSIWW
jgi:hypothetical protein